MIVKLKWRNRFRALFKGEVEVQVKKRKKAIPKDDSELSLGWIKLFEQYFNKSKRKEYYEQKR